MVVNWIHRTFRNWKPHVKIYQPSISKLFTQNNNKIEKEFAYIQLDVSRKQYFQHPDFHLIRSQPKVHSARKVYRHLQESPIFPQMFHIRNSKKHITGSKWIIPTNVSHLGTVKTYHRKQTDVFFTLQCFICTLTLFK